MIGVNKVLSLNSIRMHLQSVAKYEPRPHLCTYQEQYSHSPSHSPTPSQSTPQFTTAVKQKYYKAYLQNTQRKNAFSPTNHQPSPAVKSTNSVSYLHFRNQQPHSDNDGLLKKLDQTQEKLVRSQRNYAQVWRKYQKQLQRNQQLNRQLQQSQKERLQQLIALQNKIALHENQHKQTAEQLFVSQSSLSHLQSTLIQRNSTISRLQQTITDMTAKLALATSRNPINQEKQRQKHQQRESYVIELEREVMKMEQLIKSKDRERKCMAEEMEKKEAQYKLEMNREKNQQKRIEEEYGLLVQQSKKERIELISSYQLKLQSLNSTITSTSFTLHSLQSSLAQLSSLQAQNASYLSKIDQLHLQLQGYQTEINHMRRERQDLIGKVAAMENQMIQKGEITRNGWERGERLGKMLRQEEEKNKQIQRNYNEINRQFIQLKGKCALIFTESQQISIQRQGLKRQVNRLMNELTQAKQQIHIGKNLELDLSSRLNATVSSIKAQMMACQQEKEEIMADLLAERLQNAKLREQLFDTRTSLKQQYELSLQNTKRQLSHRIELQMEERQNREQDQQKEQLYLQLRQLERKYQLLKAQIVTVDEVMSMKAKAQRRYANRK